jgi:cation diffusion facilitator CzcD-associated flavoprotein CzcO
VQFVPEIAGQVDRLDVYQRSAPYMLPRRNPRYPAWARTLIGRVPGVQAARRWAMLAFMELFILGLTLAPPVRWALRAWSVSFMRRQLSDPTTRRRAWPDYPFGCKRILFSSAYLPALQAPGVELIDQEVAELTRRGVRTADGREREVDCVIYGTGFRAGEFVVPLRVTGREQRDLQAAWEGGAHAHLGITVPGFPNMFLLYGPNTNLGIGSIIVMLEAQARYLADGLRRLRDGSARSMEVRAEAHAAFDRRTQQRLEGSIWTKCHSWYKRDETGRVTNNWPGFMTEYVRATAAVDPADFRFEPRAERPAAAPEPVAG